MGLWRHDPEKHEGRFKLDDDIRKSLNDMSNTDEAIQMLDFIADHQDAVESAIEAVDALEKSGVFDLLKSLDAEQDVDLSQSSPAVQQLNTFLGSLNVEELENPPKVGPFQALRQMRDPDVQRGIGKVMVLLKALGKKN